MRILLYLVCLVAGDTFAQKMLFSNVPRLNSKSYYNKVIGENPGGIYVLRFRNADLKGSFTIERYSHTLDFKETVTIQVGKKERLLKIMTTDSGLFILKIAETKEKTEVFGIKTGYELKSIPKQALLYTSFKAEKNEDDIKAAYNDDRSYAAVWVSETTEDRKQRIVLLTINLLAGTHSLQFLSANLNARDIDFDETAVSPDGTSLLVLTLNRPEKRPSDPAVQEHLVVTGNSNRISEPQTLKDHKYFLSTYKIEYHTFSKQFVIAGFYDFKKPGGNHGLVMFTGNDSTTEWNQKVFMPFDRKFVTQIIGAKDEETGKDPYNFYIRKLIPRSDGGVLLVAEFFEVTQQFETFYLNGVPQTSSKNIYNYNDIILLGADSMGQIEWNHLINKRQNSFANNAYLQSMGIYVCENSLNLVYNDNSTQNNRVMHVSFSSSGDLEQKIIMNSENEYAAVVPLEGRQTGYNRFVAPVLQGRQLSLMQLIMDK